MKNKNQKKEDNPNKDEKLSGSMTPNYWLNLRWPNRIRKNKKKYNRKEKHKDRYDQ